MKWITHQTGAVAAALALQLPFLGVAGAFAGSVLPDVLDQSVSRLGRTRKARQKIFNRIHRGHSHWFGWWLLLFIAAIAAPLPPGPRALLGGAAFGAASHVLLDMLTTRGVPLLPFSHKSRLSLSLCATGTAGEYVFLGMIILASGLLMGADILEAALRLADALGQGSWADLARRS